MHSSDSDDRAPELSVMIVSFNAAGHLERTLKALTGTAAPDCATEVLVTDNGSHDDAAEVAERHTGPGSVVRLGRNTGFGYAMNRTAERARGRRLLLLNPDAEPLPGAIDALVAHLDEHPGAGIVGGRTLDVDGRLDPRSCFGRITLWSLLCWATGLASIVRWSAWFNPESMGAWQRDTPRRVDVVSGGLMLVSRTAWDRLGGFDEDYTIYGEDQDLCRRALAAGYRPSITPRAEVVHAVGASSSSRTDRDVLMLTGRASVVQRHLGASRRAGLAALSAGVALRAVAERLLGRTPRWGPVWQRRAEWALGWPGTRPSRREAVS